MALPARREVETLGTVLAAGAAVHRRALRRLDLAGGARLAAGRGRSASTDPVLGFDVGFYVFTLPVLEQARSLALALVGAGHGRRRRAVPARRPGGDHARSGCGSASGPAGTSACSSPLLLVLLAAGRLARSAAHAAHARPASSAAPAIPTSTPGCRSRWPRWPRRWSAPAWPWSTRFTGRQSAAVAAVALYARRRRSAASSTPRAIQRFVVSPNEQVREAPYIQYNIEATRRAFALDRIVQRPLTGDAELTRADIDRNRATLDNVRLWDHQPLLETFGQIQEIRTYYDFTAVDNDRYEIDGQLRQVMLSARELNPAALPNRTWVNERLTFTHGHGLTLGPVNQVTGEGLPVLFIRDLPPVSTVNLPVTEPSLYFGELSNEYAIVQTKAREFHYPKGDDNVFSTYEGTGGIVLDSLWKKLAFAARFRDYQLLLSRRHHAREPADLRPADRPAGAEDRAVPHLRRRPLSGRRTTAGCSGCSTPTR